MLINHLLILENALFVHFGLPLSNNVKSIREDHDLQIIATSIIRHNNYEDRYESCLSFLKAKFVLNSSYKLTIIHHLVLFVVQPIIKPFRCCCFFVFRASRIIPRFMKQGIDIEISSQRTQMANFQ